MTAITRWVLAHKRIVVIFWAAFAVIGLGTSQKATSALSQHFDLPGYEGFDTNSAIVHTYGNGGQLAPLIPVISLPSGTSVQAARPQLAAAFAKVAQVVPNTRIASYADTGNTSFISHDGRTTFGLLFMPPSNGPDIDPKQITAVQQALAPLTIAGAHFHLTGYSVLANNGSSGTGPGVLVETLLGGLGALAILLVVFGSALAIVPMGMAIVTIPSAFLLVWGLTGITSINFIVEFLIALIGLGVAIDYSLLIVMRWREELARGVENTEAVQLAMAHAGRAVVFSGSTVALSLLSLVVLPIPFMRSVGYAGMLIPLVSVVVASTLLPVVLATIGPRLDWPYRRRSDQPSRAWAFWSALVVRWRFPAAIGALVLLGALLSANFSLVLGVPKADALSKSGDASQGLQVLERSGIGAGVLMPYEVLVPRTEAASAAHDLAAVPGVVRHRCPSHGRLATARYGACRGAAQRRCRH